jgi:hypothetical protein
LAVIRHKQAQLVKVLFTRAGESGLSLIIVKVIYNESCRFERSKVIEAGEYRAGERGDKSERSDSQLSPRRRRFRQPDFCPPADTASGQPNTD